MKKDTLNINETLLEIGLDRRVILSGLNGIVGGKLSKLPSGGYIVKTSFLFDLDNIKNIDVNNPSLIKIELI